MSIVFDKTHKRGDSQLWVAQQKVAKTISGKIAPIRITCITVIISITIIVDIIVIVIIFIDTININVSISITMLPSQAATINFQLKFPGDTPLWVDFAPRTKELPEAGPRNETLQRRIVCLLS